MRVGIFRRQAQCLAVAGDGFVQQVLFGKRRSKIVVRLVTTQVRPGGVGAVG